MDKKFSHFYLPEEKWIKNLWENCIFVFDTNILLNFYRYSKSTREDFIKILKNVKSKIWIPYQVGNEYHNNRFETIESVISQYDDFIKRLDKIKNDLDKAKEEINKKKSHPHITSKFIEDIQVILEKEKTQIKKEKEKFGKLKEDDFILEDLKQLFRDKVGEPYSDDQLIELVKQGEFRYENEIPPGYEDTKNKSGIRKYGDLIIWFQIIDKAKESKQSVIFITDDVKEDWWKIYPRKNNMLLPKPELIKEFKDKCSKDYYMYTSDKFLNLSEKYLKQKVAQQSIREVKETRMSNIQDLLNTFKLATEVIQNKNSVLANSFQNIKDISEILSLNNLYLNPQLANLSLSNKFSDLLKNIDFRNNLNNNSKPFIQSNNLELGDKEQGDNKD